MKYQHIFFDLDHTLWDFEKNSAVALQVVYNNFKLSQMGVSTFQDFSTKYHIINEKLWDRFRKGFISRELLRWKRVYVTLNEYGIFNEELSKQMSDLYLEELPKQNFLFEGALNVLEYCKNKGCKIHLITNGFEETQIQKMTNSNILNYFDAIITSEKAMCLKPHKEIYDFAFAQTGALASNSLMIGDGLQVDVLGALNVGMDAVWFNPLLVKEDGDYTYQINKLEELLDLI